MLIVIIAKLIVYKIYKNHMKYLVELCADPNL